MSILHAAPDEGTRIVMPWPPSYNRYWRSGSRGSYISKEGMAYKRAAAQVLALDGCKPLQGAVAVYLDFYRPRKSGDLDNRFKQVLDALQGWAYCDDAQIIEIHARRFDDKAAPRVVVLVCPAHQTEGSE